MSISSEDKEHHKQQELCKTRPAYRQGRKLTAVKVYTVNNESQHLFIYGVPKINLRYELKSLCSKYGQILSLHVVVDHETEIFTECYHVQYQRIQSARIAKSFMDGKSFYGGLLHVCYVPEYENLEETRAKLLQRKKDVEVRVGDNASQNTLPNIKSFVQESRKRKRPALSLTGERMANLNPDEIWAGVPPQIDPRLPDVAFPKVGEPVRHYQLPAVEYGPHLPDFIDKASSVHNHEPSHMGESDCLKKITLIPTQVKSVKRIVFKNKEK